MSVVLGHCSYYEFTEKLVNQYHLAIFFFVSGYLFKEKYLTNFVAYFKRKISTLYIPFVFSGVIFILLHNLFFCLNIYDYKLTLDASLKDIISLCLKLVSLEPLLGAMWFCPTLLFVSFISYFSIKFIRGYSSPSRMIYALIVPMTIGAVSLYLLKLKSPYCIWQNMILSSIFLTGWIFSRYERFVKNTLCSPITFISLICLLVIMTWSGLYGRLQPDVMKMENPIIIYAVACIGCLSIYGFSNKIGYSIVGTVFEWLGKYSFSIMMLHFLCFKIVNIIQCVSYDLPLTRISDFPVTQKSVFWSVIFVVVGCSLPILMNIMWWKTVRLFVKNEKE